ncbi:MAG: hypothetical protein ACFFCD_02820 [Promethearchaeota archaeon]
MKIELEVELTDKPGELVRCLEPISAQGGNILQVIHHRSQSVGKGVAPVSIHFEVENIDVIKDIKNTIEKQGVHVVKWAQEFVGFKKIVLLIGHVFQKDITDTIIRLLDSGVLVNEVNAKITQKEEVSTVKFSIVGDTEQKIQDAMNLCKEICMEKGLFLIRG